MKSGSVPLFIVCYNTDKKDDNTYNGFINWYDALDWKEKIVFHMGDLINEEKIDSINK